MNLLRSVALLRSIVFLMIAMMLFHSIDSPDVVRNASKIDMPDNIAFVDRVTFEHDARDKEGRISGLAKVTLYKHQISDLDLSSLVCISVEFNSLNPTNLFKSITSDLPSPPPRG